MANHLHWYTGGTIGGTDGTEIDITQPINLGAVNTFSLISAGQNDSQFYFPVIGFPLFLRTEPGYEIAQGALSCAYYNIDELYIGAIGKNNSSFKPILFQTKLEFEQLMAESGMTLASNSTSSRLTITDSNKITAVNSMLFICVMAPSIKKIGLVNQVDLISFSFTETAVTA